MDSCICNEKPQQLFICQGCNNQVYCSQKCQFKHWLYDHRFQCIGNPVISSAGKSGVALRPAKLSLNGQIPGEYRIIKMIVDVTTTGTQQPSPGSRNLVWKELERPIRLYVNARYWRTEISGTGSERLYLGSKGNVIDYIEPLTETRGKQLEPQDQNTVISLTAPEEDVFIIYFIRLILYTHDNDAPAARVNNRIQIDKRFSIWQAGEPPIGFKFWENRKLTVKEGILNGTGITLRDPDAITGDYGQEGRGDRALKTATRKPRSPNKKVLT